MAFKQTDRGERAGLWRVRRGSSIELCTIRHKNNESLLCLWWRWGDEALPNVKKSSATDTSTFPFQLRKYSAFSQFKSVWAASSLLRPGVRGFHIWGVSVRPVKGIGKVVWCIGTVVWTIGRAECGTQRHILITKCATVPHTVTFLEKLLGI